MFKAKRMGIAVAVETMYGSDKLPTAALNAMLVENVKLGALDGDEIERPHVRPGSSGAFFKTLINKRVTLSFDVRLRGAGAAGGMLAAQVALVKRESDRGRAAPRAQRSGRLPRSLSV